MIMRIRQILIVCLLQLPLSTNGWGEVSFAHITDLHIFEETKWECEAKISTIDFSKSIKKEQMPLLPERRNCLIKKYQKNFYIEREGS